MAKEKKKTHTKITDGAREMTVQVSTLPNWKKNGWKEVANG